MPQRPTGRGLFYTRDSGGKHETTPGEYVLWAARAATQLGVRFSGTPAQIERMIRDDVSADGDVFLDYVVKGNILSRQGLDALYTMVAADRGVSHVFIPRRDRLARLNNVDESMALERRFIDAGVTVVFMNHINQPSNSGKLDMATVILQAIEYGGASHFRYVLAEKMLYVQLKLAKDGFATGGRPPYGFCRWLVREADGGRVRLLGDGERVKLSGHRVIWLPDQDEQRWAVIRRILDLVSTIPVHRIAATLTSERVPAPGAGRTRKDNGVRHVVSGVWHPNTVAEIARNPLLRAVVEYGERSTGDQLRFAANQPRELTDADRKSNGRPKPVTNPPAARISVPARFAPPVDPKRAEAAVEALAGRGASQRGKPRSHDPARNPLGCRVFDMACGWPMYRKPHKDQYRYCCGYYQQSHGAACNHNTIDGPTATRFVLTCVRQRVLDPLLLEQVRERLRVLAEQSHHGRPARTHATQSRLDAVRLQRAQAERNMALAATPEQFAAVARVADELRREEQALEREVRAAREAGGAGVDPDTEVRAAMAVLDDLSGLAGEADDLTAVSTLFTQLNARLFLRFQAVTQGKRTLNRLSAGVLTFGVTEPPVKMYQGPTGRAAVKTQPPPPADESTSAVPAPCTSSGREEGSLGNGSSGGWGRTSAFGFRARRSTAELPRKTRTLAAAVGVEPT